MAHPDITNECEEQEPRGNFWVCFFLFDSVSIGPSQTFLAVMLHHIVIFSKFQILSLEEILKNKMKTNVWRHVGRLHHH